MGESISKCGGESSKQQQEHPDVQPGDRYRSGLDLTLEIDTHADFDEVSPAYMAATATSVGLAVGLTKAVPRLPVSQGMRSVLARLVPFVSVASAGVVNISCIRWKEMREGVQVFRLKHDDAKGHEEIEVVGKSSEAGKRAVGQSAASRVLTNIPTLVLPPVLMSLLEKRGTFVGPRGKLLSTATQLTLSESRHATPLVSQG